MSFAPYGASGHFGEIDEEQVRVVEDALEVLGPDPSAERAHLLIELTAQIGDVRVDESVELARQAEAIARELGDPDVLGRVLLGARRCSTIIRAESTSTSASVVSSNAWGPTSAASPSPWPGSSP